MVALTRFGNPILRKQVPHLSAKDIKSDAIQKFITNLKADIESKDYGVGLAAPQVGKGLRIAVIDIKPTKLRPDVENYKAVIINPTYEGIGQRASMWEGCLSSGTSKDALYAKALRYRKIRAAWFDEFGKKHSKELSGLPAHVFQHETDHLNGILFVDLVRDTRTYMHSSEYRKRILKKGKK